ncbi:MAG: FAD-binding oxidoreductase, partial [Candidatus Binatia bacterium]
MHPRHHTVPRPAHLLTVLMESPDTRTFTFGLNDAETTFDTAGPGQFAMLSVFGHGEAAFTFSGLPGVGGRPGEVAITVRRVGSLTAALFELPLGARVGLRGPFGRGFPTDRFDVPTLFVAGGCGLSPLKA